MKPQFSAGCRFALFSLLVLGLWRPCIAAAKAQVVVDDDKVECPNAAFIHIQDAVDAASPGAAGKRGAALTPNPSPRALGEGGRGVRGRLLPISRR